MVRVQTGNMLDVVVEGKSIGLKQRDSDHRKYETIWLPDPENFCLVLMAEIGRLNGKQKDCIWKYDPDGYWQTQCGDQFCFSEAGPTENRVKFCHFCGKSVSESIYANETANG